MVEVGVEQFVDGDGFVAVWAVPARADAGARPVAVVAPLVAEVAGVAVGAGVDGVPAAAAGGWWCGRRRWCGLAAAPGGAAAAW